jgi:hypothetical protein
VFGNVFFTLLMQVGFMPSRQRTWHVMWKIKREYVGCTLAAGCTEVGDEVSS